MREALEVFSSLASEFDIEASVSREAFTFLIPHNKHEALELRKELLGPKHPETAKSLYNLRGILEGLGRHEEAVALKLE